MLTAAPLYKCPAAPYEAALLDYGCRRRKIRGEIQIDLYAAEPAPMAVAGPTVSAGVRQMVEAKRIGYHPEHQVERVDPKAKQVHFANGTDAGFDLLAYVPPHRAPRVIRESGLTGESGWVPVDRRSLETSFPNVYAIGDVNSIPLQLGKPLPKAGTFAHGEAKVVADNIAAPSPERADPRSSMATARIVNGRVYWRQVAPGPELPGRGLSVRSLGAQR